MKAGCGTLGTVSVSHLNLCHVRRQIGIVGLSNMQRVLQNLDEVVADLLQARGAVPVSKLLRVKARQEGAVRARV